jgi:transcriptional regulator with XRE-family HTH domain
VPEGDSIPHKVVGLTVKKGYPLVRAWREYLKLTQAEVADRMGISQAALSQMEAGGKRLRKATLEKPAAAMGIRVEQRC